MKIIIAGGRDYSPKRHHVLKILGILEAFKCSEIISGTCDGADVFGEMFYFVLPESRKRLFPANWNDYGKAAGPLRNEAMAKYADGCILLPGGNGTANMKMNAEKYNLKIWEIS